MLNPTFFNTYHLLPTPLSTLQILASSSMATAAEKAKDVAVGEVKRIEKLTNDAARSGAYLYPIRVCPSYSPFNDADSRLRDRR